MNPVRDRRRSPLTTTTKAQPRELHAPLRKMSPRGQEATLSTPSVISCQLGYVACAIATLVTRVSCPRSTT